LGYINRKAEIVYLAHPRTASRATSEALTEQAGFITKHENRSQLGHHARMYEKIPSDWLIFTTIRNHFDTQVSWYFKDGARDKPPFDEGFIKRNLTTLYFPIRNRMWGLHGRRANHLIRYENLDDELNSLLESRGLGPVELPRIGVSENRQNRSYEPFYDKPAREYIESRFRNEMAELKYSWGD
jgi:hypothetical protein